MELFEVMLGRRSVRNYTSDAIDGAKLDKIMAAGLLAPTSRNKKPCEFILVQDRGMLVKLSEAKAAGSAMLAGASAAIVVIADSDRSDVWIEDSSIALTYMHLMATELGVGSCWVQCRNRKTADGGDSEVYVREVLSIPDRYRSVGILSLGVAGIELPLRSIEIADGEKIHREHY